MLVVEPPGGYKHMARGEQPKVYGGGRWERCGDPKRSRYQITHTGDGRGPCIKFFPCGVTSYNLNDIANRYCALCHEWIKTPQPDRPAR